MVYFYLKIALEMSGRRGSGDLQPIYGRREGDN
jgi:hypothetical protein